MRWTRWQGRLGLAGAAAVFALLGAGIALGVAFAAGYGWFGDDPPPQRTSNLTLEQAERYARSYAVQQLRLVQPKVVEVTNLPGGLSLRREQPQDPATVDRPFATIESRFLADGDTSSAGALAVRPAGRSAGAWLFVFRAGSVEVPEWGTTNAVFEVQVLLSDSSGRVLQSGSTLLPEIRPDAAAVHR